MKTRAWFMSLCLLAVVLAFPSQVGATQTLIDQTVTVDNLSYRYWYRSFDTGDRLSGSVYGSSDINFYILTSSDFADFSAGSSFHANYYQQKVSSLPSFSFTLPYDGTWYIVLDNQYSLFTSKSVAITVYLDPYDPFSQPSGYAPDLSGFFVFIGIVVLVVVILVVYSTAEKRKRMEGAPKPQVPPPPPSL